MIDAAGGRGEGDVALAEADQGAEQQLVDAGGPPSWQRSSAAYDAGILTEQADAWFYKPNRGNGTFGPLERVAAACASAAAKSSR